MGRNDQLVFMVTIVKRESCEKFINIYNEGGHHFNMVTLGKGTAAKETLDLLGLESTKKAVIFSILSKERANAMRESIVENLNLDKAGAGINFVIPMEYIAKLNGIKHFDGCRVERDDLMEEGQLHEVIIAIANRGYSEDVMEAAHSVRNVGGTIIKARGAGHEAAEKFFKVTIQPEKDVIMLVVAKEYTEDVIKAIVSKAGIDTPAHAVAISLPVSQVAGLTIM